MPTILLVDDEKILRTLVRIAFERRGHKVLDASSGRRAITIAQKHSGPIDLLVTELSLPRMSGLGLAASLAPERPEMRTLFLSRAPKSNELVSEAQATGAEVLAEPFEIGGLLDRADAALATQRRKPPARSADPDTAATRAGNGG